MDDVVLTALLARLREDFERKDGKSAATTLDMIRIWAGDDFTDRLTAGIIALGLERLRRL
ncbi:hypothetical protein [Winogradskya humida]|uniref:Uncharacterized protein n=1 Tax=Winogradskya humida TaxID=113566 RepID=A0ABQ3ZU49_9ACTN|nr:hypothetical protein [Actinoplanes humidus]GIE22130.1 hypothetical protein Ahu01nite_052320 [Actinoplanes humidus]